MMNVQFFHQLTFTDVTALAYMTISLAHSSCLSVPVTSIIRFATTSPTRVAISSHAYRMFFVKTLLGTIISFSLLVRLKTYFLVANKATSNYSWRILYNVFRCPQSNAFATAKIVFPFRTWRYAFRFTTKVAFNNYWHVTTGFTKMFLLPVCVPVWTLDRCVA